MTSEIHNKTASGNHPGYPSLRNPLLWLVVCNLVGRALWVLFMHPAQVADFDWYFTHAIQLANGQGYVSTTGHPTAYWPIGWPLVLAGVIKVFGAHEMAGLFANVVLSTLIVVLVYLLTLRVLGSEHRPWHARWIALAAAVAYSLLPSQIEWDSILGSEESFTILLMLTLFIYAGLVCKSAGQPWLWRTAAAGLIFGFASIVRPIGLLFPVFLFAYELFVNRRTWIQAIGRGLAFGIAMFIGILPMTIRNLRVMHHFVLVSTNGGVNLWQGTKINGGYFWTWNPYKNPLLKAAPNEVKENNIGKHVALTHILHHPIETVHMGFIKIFDLYKVDTNAVWYTFHIQYKGNTPLLYTFDILDTVAYWFMMAVVLVALFTLFRRRLRAADPNHRGLQFHSGLPQSLGLLLTFVVYNTLLFFFFPAWDRFRYPLMPVFAVFFGIGWWVVMRCRNDRKAQKSINPKG